MQDTGFWQLPLTAIEIGEMKFDLCPEILEYNQFCGAIIDSGTSFLGIPVE
jgi:hypothetical protein